MKLARFSRSVSIEPSSNLAKASEKYAEENPRFRKAIKAQHKRAISLAVAHEFNGADLFVDKYLRNFLREYNGRVLKGEGGKLPLSFNVLNAFVEPDVDALILKLLPEKIYSLGLDSILDFITDPKISVDFSSLVEKLEEFEIYEFNMIGGYADFHIPGHDKFVFCGAGFVRNHDEVSIIGIFGRENLKKKKNVIPVDAAGIFPGKERLFEDKTEVDYSDDDLFGDPNYEPVILLTRISLTDKKIQARYLLEEKKGAFNVASDDQEMFDEIKALKGKDVEVYIRNNIEKIQRLDNLFSILTLIPGFVTKLEDAEDDLLVERHPTRFRTEANTAAVRKMRTKLSLSETPNFVPVHSLVTTGNGGSYSTPASGLKVETKGFWKTLPLGTVGADRHGQPVQGKTWVEVTKSWFETLGFQQADVGQSISVDVDKGVLDVRGYIYVMRSAMHARDVYKIGYTTKTPDERALELGSETGQPDMFNVVQFWEVRGPYSIERQIHTKLAASRLRAGREFFKMKYPNIRKAIEEIIDANDALI